MRLSELKTDPELELNGKWCPIGDGGEVLVARLYNEKFNEYYNNRAQAIGTKVLRKDQAIQEELLLDAMSRTVLLDWRGIDDDNDKPIKYTQKVGLQALTEIREFRDQVTELASSYETFRLENLEDDVKN